MPHELKENNITGQNIADLLCSAIESAGIGYWVDRVSVVKHPYPRPAYAQDVVSRGGIICLHESKEHGEGGRKFLLTRRKMIKGIKLAANHKGLAIWRFFEEADAEAADMAVQYAVFGELIYG